MSRKYRVVSQIWDKEAKTQGILDDCGPSSMAAALNWASGADNFGAASAVAARIAVTGQADRQGVADGGTGLSSLIKVVRHLGGRARYAKSWEDAMTAGKSGAAIGVWVEQPVGYPAGLEISAWHRRWKKSSRRKPGDSYGHMTSAGYDAEIGWQWACPTRTGKGAEQYAVPVTEAQLKVIADSKRVSGKHKAPAYQHLIIVTWPKAATTDLVPPKTEKAEPAPVVVPIAPTPAPVVPSKPEPVVPAKPIVAAIRRIIGRFGRIAK